MRFSMSIIFLIFLLSIFSQLGCVSKKRITNNKTFSEKYLSILENDKTLWIFNIDSLPPTAIKKLQQLNNNNFEMANPSDNFRNTDNITTENESFVNRRLIFAAKLSNELILAYEIGGRSHLCFVNYFRFNKRCSHVKYLASTHINIKKDYKMKNIIDAIKSENFKILYNDGYINSRKYAFY